MLIYFFCIATPDFFAERRILTNKLPMHLLPSIESIENRRQLRVSAADFQAHFNHLLLDGIAGRGILRLQP